MVVTPGSWDGLGGLPGPLTRHSRLCPQRPGGRSDPLLEYPRTVRVLVALTASSQRLSGVRSRGAEWVPYPHRAGQAPLPRGLSGCLVTITAGHGVAGYPQVYSVGGVILSGGPRSSHRGRQTVVTWVAFSATPRRCL
jgi:hypothetical protein